MIEGMELFAALPDETRRLEAPAGVTDLHQLDLPDGIYEGMRTFADNRFLYLERHLSRAQRSAMDLGWSEPVDEQLLRRGLHEAATAFPGDERLRLDIFEHPTTVLGVETRVLLALAPYRPVPAELMERGARVGIAHGLGRMTPHIKRNEWIARRRGSGPGDRGCYEHLLVDDDRCILEGSSSNVFAVRDGALLTAPAGMLGGIQRGIFLELAEREGVPVELVAPRLDDIERLDEMFLTSSSRAAVPIVEVEGQTVGSGRPGPVLHRLLAAYATVTAEARPALDF
ncbi:MAG: aminotransferase class IV [Planctomycetota bacterium]